MKKIKEKTETFTHYDGHSSRVKKTEKHTEGYTRAIIAIACVLALIVLAFGYEYYFVRSHLDIGESIALEAPQESPQTPPETPQAPKPSEPVETPPAPSAHETEATPEEVPDEEIITDEVGGDSKVPEATDFDSEVASIVFQLTNEERSKQGLAAYGPDPVLGDMAYRKSAHMGKLGYFSHVAPDGTTTYDWLKTEGQPYAGWGENIADYYDFGSAQKTAEAIMDGWMNSSGHRANILGDFELLGVGVYTTTEGRVMATQVFGTK